MKLVVAAAWIGLSALACSAPTRARRLLPARVAGASYAMPASGLIERDLKRRGLRFGTDGSVRALWGYMRSSHLTVEARQARPGDVLFFEVAGRIDQPPACADHAGLVRRVDADGRITFVESRDGVLHESYVHPARPRQRRDELGRILNTFLRPKKIDDPDGARYFAGEMLCAVTRPRR